MQLMQSDNPVSRETGILNRKWKALRFIFAKRSFESQLEAILTAAAGHESNSLPVGDYQYEVLNVPRPFGLNCSEAVPCKDEGEDQASGAISTG